MRYKNIKTNNYIVATQEFIDKLDDSLDWEEVIDEEQVQDLESLKLEKIKNLNENIDRAYKDYLSKYPEIETESFKTKAEESAKILDDTAIPLTSTYYITKLAKKTLEEMGNLTPTDDEILSVRNSIAVAVDEKSDYVAELEINGVMIRDQIKACATFKELEDVEV